MVEWSLIDINIQQIYTTVCVVQHVSCQHLASYLFPLDNLLDGKKIHVQRDQDM